MSHQYQWTLLRAGSLRLDGGSMFGVVPRTIWSRMTMPDEQNRIFLQTNCLLLDDGSSKILIETGFGGKWSDKERGYFDLERRTVVDALREHGVETGQIDHVILTHLHFDHAAGLTHPGDGGEPVSSFDRAAIHIQHNEWDDALSNRSTMTRTYLESHLRPVAGQVRLAGGEQEILPGIAVEPLPGHTWGQHGVRFDDGHGVICFPGDVMPTVHHAGLAFSMGYDMMPYQNMLTKKALLERAVAEGWRLVLDHEPGDPVQRVEADPDRPDRYLLQPASDATPL